MFRKPHVVFGNLFLIKMNLAGGEVVHAADQADLTLVKHLAQDGAAFTDLLHDQAYVRLGYLVHKFKVF